MVSGLRRAPLQGRQSLGTSTADGLREWFVSREVVLLQLRWATLPQVERDRALASLGVTLGEDLPGLPKCQLPFTQVPPQLLAERRVVLKRGVAHVPAHETCALASYLFDRSLRDSMQKGAFMMQSEQHRLQLESVRPLLDRLGRHADACVSRRPARAATGPDDVGLSLTNFNQMLRSFPPCMLHMVLHQRGGQRLKFQGLLQLRPFLRRAGLDLPSALRWWEMELRRDMHVTKEVFEKDHRYQIEHAYGACGHGGGAHPFGCARIQGFPAPRAGQVHGCPFQRGHEGQYDLAALLGHWGLEPQGVDVVVRAARDGPPSRACAEFFRATHPWTGWGQHGPVGHPNTYLRRSMAALATRCERAAFAAPAAVAP
ncbi:unnamed protein product [Prorocentrum cordatum]|uniref:DNA primase large subunit C-terminal domain-containing protein n=1 Tax=Prorocentrum cordatum TaxID=2364126 RepID=A0ABN9W5M6_9DINO|nr:unnamed protein product [Polarella glacialis]